MLDFFLCLILDVCTLGNQMLMDCNLMLWVICMRSRYCLLIDIDRRKIKWNNTIFEVEVECRLQWSWRKKVWLIVMHVNTCQVISAVAIWWDQRKCVQKTNNVCFMWYQIILCQGRWWFSSDHIWAHQVLFQLLHQFPILMIHSCCQIYCWK